ncbi:hypothetical protein PTRA_a1986 [Pseudoalteromonas translucida KMM 520]|uniref:RiboL-PSP-HEPN domain-containing protein n=1 Tax=Pseudoalteromonas translucida KMM 520 TaxID=1315283 RepID=A0A0U2VF08_9GAMM|nr:hypothetical protein PTRA_a1986 [Pseudoalteromonas translucida KMM 520]
MESLPLSRTKKVKITVECPEIIPLQSIASNQFNMAEKEEPGHKFRWIIPSMIFSVFSVEATANVYGSQLFKSQWKNFESTSIIGKIILVSKELGVDADFSAQPWQTIQEMIKFRNWLAHAKPHKTTATHEVPHDTPNDKLPRLFPDMKIAAYSDIDSAARYKEAARQLELIWTNGAMLKDIDIDLIGRPQYTNVS